MAMHKPVPMSISTSFQGCLLTNQCCNYW